MPWCDAYKQELLRTLAFADHETYDYPVACTSSKSQHACHAFDMHDPDVAISGCKAQEDCTASAQHACVGH